ncbi:helix-turn-helix transcriptional regulator [Aquincola tertiaricarbonis]|uniref:Helix-turn-helix transcriptional regulator n=1 Tax=Aquincola tertiaricarbonis TaxID=391953 RepID=A0ABY4S9R2_AQUTE|nr:helix-turn-helix domain-containing protein [Aquincola tertiaricarbonis]URI08637.1 helix-turn-helix transcriptional regulator [Aquincola tertiaricarbonis]
MTLHKSTADFAELCPIRDVLERLGDRWTMLVLFTLDEGGTQRFSTLKARIPDVSQRMLAQTLRRLEQDGLVVRTAYATVPPRVEYALTPLGTSFMDPMRQLVHWAAQHHEQVRTARQAYRPVQAAAPL